MHTQCKLKKRIKNGIASKVAWIPSKYAKLGKYLMICNDDGWKVVNIYSSKESKEVVSDSQDYKKHRQTTDI